MATATVQKTASPHNGAETASASAHKPKAKREANAHH